MQLTVHDHWLLQTFPQSDPGERSEAERALPPDLIDALDRARMIQAGLEPIAAAPRAVVEAAINMCHGKIAVWPFKRVVLDLLRLRAAQANQGSGG
jgi:hypothetical protein